MPIDQHFHMSFILFQSPGQTVTIVFETLDGYGSRSDGYSIPVITRVIFPSLALASGYPQTMTRLDVGLYTFQLTLPTMASAIGTYIVDIAYQNPETGLPEQTFGQIVCTAPYGQYTVSTF
jgi:hypothetical protein